MKYTLSDFNGRYHSMPNAVMDLLSGDAFLVFSRIYAHSKKTLCADDIYISAKTLSKLTRRSERKIAQSIKELEDIGFVFIKGSERGKRTFTINWEEIYKLSQFTSNISYDGVSELNEICHAGGDTIPFSQIPQEVLAKISAEYKYEPKSADIPAFNAQMSADSDKNIHQTAANSALNTKNAAVSTQSAANPVFNAEMSAVLSSLLQKMQQINPTNAENAAVLCNNASHYIVSDNGKFDLYVVLSNAEQIIASKLGINAIKLLFKSADISYISDKSADISDISGAENAADSKNLLTFVHTDKYIYKYNKDNHIERSSINIGDKNVSKKDWDETRDLSLPCFSQHEIDDILANSFYDSSSDKLIRFVYPQIEQDEVLLDERGNEIANIIPVSFFDNIIHRAITSLKEDDPDFNITEEQAKNIFGFEVVDMGEEFGYKIDPTKIRKIDVSLTSRTEKANSRRHGVDGRKAIHLFVDCIKEIGDNNVDNLTDAEIPVYAILKATEEGCDVEITKATFQLRLNEWIEKYDRPKDIFEEVLDKLPKRGNKIKLRPTALSVDYIVNLNIRLNQASDVEDLYAKKMAEQD